MDAPFRNRGLAFVYAATIFVSAFLLFQIQPMISKAILPWFGGTPAVWTICLLFFQTLLFTGYAYAHFTTAWLRPGKQAMLHILVIIVALAFLNVLPDARWQPRGDADPTRAILVILAVTIGLPYFVLSATGPLLQAWFARSFPGGSPYRLYALSNIGSLLALLGYPFLFERMFDLKQQQLFWSVGFIVFAFLCAFAAWRMRRSEIVGQGVADNSGGHQTQPDVQSSAPSPQPSPMGRGSQGDEPPLSHYLLWLLLPAFASVVLMATTNHISTDVAVVPLLWVVPLALYLITFIIAFDRPAWYWPTLTAVLTLAAIYPTSALYKKNNVGTLKLYECGITGRTAEMVADFFNTPDESETDQEESEGPSIRVGFRTALFVNFAAMFGTCMLCHGQLARLKPHTRHLTAYYLMMSGGGALGGIAVSLIAPHVFKTIVEWKVAIFAAAAGAVAVILSALVNRAVDPDAVSTPLAPFGEAHGEPHEETHEAGREGLNYRPSSSKFWPRMLLAATLVPAAFIMLDLVEFLFSQQKDVIYQSRNFFGALTIRERNVDDPKKHEIVLLNGTTIHGSQFKAPERRGQPTSYYATTSGIGRVLNFFHGNRPPGGVRIGVVGLGAGGLAAYALKFDTIVFYEINPTVLDISTSGEYFTYIPDARARGANYDIRMGDARLTLQREVEGGKQLPYHVLVLDAFSGDAVPTHLLTAEAMDIYRPLIAAESNMGVEGALLIHVSNRYLNLYRVARGAGDYLKFTVVEIHNAGIDAQGINTSNWVVLTRNKDLLAALAPHADRNAERDQPPILWTDAHSSLFEILR